MLYNWAEYVQVIANINNIGQTLFSTMVIYYSKKMFFDWAEYIQAIANINNIYQILFIIMAIYYSEKILFNWADFLFFHIFSYIVKTNKFPDLQQVYNFH